MNFTTEQLERARNANLYLYMKTHHPELIKGGERGSIRPTFNPSISIKKDASWFKDFSTGKGGNAVTFLTDHLNYGMVEAVLSLCEVETSIPAISSKPLKRDGSFPEATSGNFSRLFAYLLSRGIDKSIIQMLVRVKLMYQSKQFANIIFINKERDFAESRATIEGIRPHGCYGNNPKGFWYFMRPGKTPPNKVYICESAIDAISLYQIRNEDAFYISINGVDKQAKIDLIKEKSAKRQVIIAVDNDKAGQACRDRNPELNYIVPQAKDWNEDLRLQGGGREHG